MASKLIALLACISFASAGTLPAAGLYYSAPQALAKAAPLAVAQPVLAKADDQYDPNPQYNFAYDVQDSLSGDSHSQFESRDGDVVRGQYSLVDADGYKRTVEYTADPLHGFNAVVSREPLGVATKSVAAPGLVKSAPVAYYQHQPQLIRAAPLAHVAAPAAFLSHQPLAYAHH